MRRGVFVIAALWAALLLLPVGRAAAVEFSDDILYLDGEIDELGRMTAELAAYQPSYTDGYALHQVLARSADRAALYLECVRDVLTLGTYADDVRVEDRERFVGQVRLTVEKYRTLLARRLEDLTVLLAQPIEADPFVQQRAGRFRLVLEEAGRRLEEIAAER